MAELPEHLRKMALYALYSGSRDKEVYWLKWEWEVRIPQLSTSVFIIPAFIQVNGARMRLIKNGHDRLVVLNRITQEVIESVRGEHPEFVFTYKGKPRARMNNSAWRKARERAGLPHFRVHDLKHTYGRRLRRAGVGLEDREDLLGHKSQRMTTHYSTAELVNLVEAANKACVRQTSSPTLMLLKNTKEVG